MHRTLLLFALAGCYEPELRDCTVTCSGSDECADGQICGSDGMCAVPEAAGHCTDGSGAPTPHASLRVTIDGHGSVLVTGHPACVSDEDSHDPCNYSLAAGATIDLRAQALDEDKPFDHWSGDCAGQSATCTVVAASGLSVGAKFK